MPHTHHSLDLPWGTLAFTDSGGAGRPLVFLHGTGCDSTDWMEAFDELPEGLRLIAMDFRGHGGSSVPAPFTLGDLATDALALMDALRLRRPWLVGHSLGGMVALEVLRRGASLGGVVLLEGWTRLLQAMGFDGTHFYGHLDAGQVACIQAKYAAVRAQFSEADWTYFWSTVEQFDATDVLDIAEVPVVAVFGDCGRGPDTESLLALPSNPLVHLVWLPECGHYLPHERPDAVAWQCMSALLQFPTS